MCRQVGVMLALAGAVYACGSAPSSTNPTGPQTITSSQRLYWNQTAGSAAEMASIRFAIYLDGARSELPGAQCVDSSVTDVYNCNSPLPKMTVGPHLIQLASYYYGFDQLETRAPAITVVYVG